MQQEKSIKQFADQNPKNREHKNLGFRKSFELALHAMESRFDTVMRQEEIADASNKQAILHDIYRIIMHPNVAERAAIAQGALLL